MTTCRRPPLDGPTVVNCQVVLPDPNNPDTTVDKAFSMTGTTGAGAGTGTTGGVGITGGGTGGGVGITSGGCAAGALMV